MCGERDAGRESVPTLRIFPPSRLSEMWSFVAVRGVDEQVSYGRLTLSGVRYTR